MGAAANFAGHTELRATKFHWSIRLEEPTNQYPNTSSARNYQVPEL